LAGYLTSVNGHKISFVIINQNILKARQARKLQDKICELLIQLN
jgi:D-alanyl-D-alanine carboxypeptidase/D-alanyl-D-alanine-endopeptidase (penicillin-binding protein 4)